MQKTGAGQGDWKYEADVDEADMEGGEGIPEKVT